MTPSGPLGPTLRFVAPQGLNAIIRKVIMPPLATLDASRDRSESRTAGRRRVGHVAAYLAAPLWALQGVIWLAAPKVQEAAPPFAITKPLLFVLFWLSIAGAVAFSAACAADIPRTIQGLGSRVSRWAKVLATMSLGLATAAAISIVAAVFPGFQGVAIGLMTNMLNGALLILALSVSLSAFISWRVNRASRSTSLVVTAVAVATSAMIAAIFASGSHSVIGLYVAVAVAAVNGTVWLIWARASASGPRR
jgi:hypothetical protein